MEECKLPRTDSVSSLLSTSSSILVGCAPSPLQSVSGESDATCQLRLATKSPPESQPQKQLTAGASSLALDTPCNSAAEPSWDPVQLLQPELCHQILQHLPAAEQAQTALVNRAWRTFMQSVAPEQVAVTTRQVVQPSFLAWLSTPGRANKVAHFVVTAAPDCNDEDVAQTLTSVRRLLRGLTAYADPIFQPSVQLTVNELPASLTALELGHPALVNRGRLSFEALPRLRRLRLTGGCFREVTGLPASLACLHLHHDVAFSSLTGELQNLTRLHCALYDQQQTAYLLGLPCLQVVKLHLYAGVGLDVSVLSAAEQLRSLALVVHGANLVGIAAVGRIRGLRDLSVTFDMSFYCQDVMAHEAALLGALELPPGLASLAVRTSSRLPPRLLHRLATACPTVRLQFGTQSYCRGPGDAATNGAPL